MPTLRLRGVGRRFGGLHAVREVDLEVAPGERRAILGPNGAGKTTLFNVICGDFPATAGTVELFGRDVTPLPARTRTKTGLGAHLPAVPALRWPDGRGQHLPVDPRRHGRPPPAGDHCAATPRCASVRVRLPGGWRSTTSCRSSSARSRTASTARSALAVALAAEPEMLMLDEPCLRPLARRAPAAHRAPARPRARHHPDRDRARHGRRAQRRGAGDDDARRPRDRRGHPRRDPRPTSSSTTSISGRGHRNE